MKLYEASIEKFLLAFVFSSVSPCRYFHFSHRSVYLSLYKQADFELKRDTSNGEGFSSWRVQRKGNGTRRTPVRCTGRKKREGLAGISAYVRFGKQWSPELYFCKLVVVWEFTSNTSCLRQTFIYSPFIVQFRTSHRNLYLLLIFRYLICIERAPK